MDNCQSTARSCSTNCCDIWGDCPATASGCYYYYGKVGADSYTSTSSGLSGGAIVAIIAGGIVAFFVIIILISCCARQGRVPQRRPMPAYVNQTTATTIVTQPTPITPIVMPPPPFEMAQPFTAVQAPSRVPPAYHNKQLYNTPEPYYG